MTDLESRIRRLEAGRPVAEMVAEFHAAMGDTPKYGLAPGDRDARELRRWLLDEEFGEYEQAEDDDDIVGISDALADMVYVIYGTAYSYGIPLDRVVAEVHRSNMTKDFVPGGKAKKGPGYEAPRIAEILAGEDVA